MLTQEQVLKAVKAGRKSGCIDGRDYSRLVDFFPLADWEAFGFKYGEGQAAAEYVPRPWTREELLKQLADDVQFGAEKAADERGISASMMYEVVKMWMWILEDDLEHTDHGSYGWPMFRAVASEYGISLD